MVRRSIAVICIPIAMMICCMWGCDPDQDSPDYATISGRIFTDSTMTQGVEDVEVLVESDIESQMPYEGPDQFAWTDEHGYFSVSFYMGHTSSGSGVVEHTYVADCRVSYWYRGRMFDWVSGVTVGSGKEYSLPDVHLGQFQ